MISRKKETTTKKSNAYTHTRLAFSIAFGCVCFWFYFVVARQFSSHKSAYKKEKFRSEMRSDLILWSLLTDRLCWAFYEIQINIVVQAAKKTFQLLILLIPFVTIAWFESKNSL